MTGESTDHSQVIAHLRLEAVVASSEPDAVNKIAAATLLELHDRGAFNLHETLGLLDFVQLWGDCEVANNHLEGEHHA